MLMAIWNSMNDDFIFVWKCINFYHVKTIAHKPNLIENIKQTQWLIDSNGSHFFA